MKQSRGRAGGGPGSVRSAGYRAECPPSPRPGAGRGQRAGRRRRRRGQGAKCERRPRAPAARRGSSARFFPQAPQPHAPQPISGHSYRCPSSSPPSPQAPAPALASPSGDWRAARRGRGDGDGSDTAPLPSFSATRRTAGGIFGHLQSQLHRGLDRRRPLLSVSLRLARTQHMTPARTASHRIPLLPPPATPPVFRPGISPLVCHPAFIDPPPP